MSLKEALKKYDWMVSREIKEPNLTIRQHFIDSVIPPHAWFLGKGYKLHARHCYLFKSKLKKRQSLSNTTSVLMVCNLYSFRTLVEEIRK